MESSTLDQILNKSESYILYGIKKEDHQNPENNSGSLLSYQLNLCIESMKNNILKSSYMAPIKKNNFGGN